MWCTYQSVPQRSELYMACLPCFTVVIKLVDQSPPAGDRISKHPFLYSSSHSIFIIGKLLSYFITSGVREVKYVPTNSTPAYSSEDRGDAVHCKRYSIGVSTYINQYGIKLHWTGIHKWNTHFHTEYNAASSRSVKDELGGYLLELMYRFLILICPWLDWIHDLSRV